MYDPETMDRNLAIGDAGEALFRYWFETHCDGLDDVVLDQLGYNPEGRVSDEEKSEMLKELADSTDFALFDKEDYEEDGAEAEPILGISINTQKGWYDMDNNPGVKLDYTSDILDRNDWGCYTCPRAQRCYDGELENLWYNEYNISNDYKLFVDEYDVDVLMVSIISTTPYNIRRKFKNDDEMFDACYRYLRHGEDALDNEQVVDFLDYLAFDQRYKNRTEPREEQFNFVLRSQLLDLIDEEDFHVTEASMGAFRPVACIDGGVARDEQELIEYISSYSEYDPEAKQPDWYVDAHQSALSEFQ